MISCLINRNTLVCLGKMCTLHSKELKICIYIFFLNDLVEVLQHLLKGYPELLAYSELETCLSLTS